MRWTRWTEFKKRRKARYNKKSTAAPVNTDPPVIRDGGNGLLVAFHGHWDNYPTDFKVEWFVNNQLVQYGNSYVLPENVSLSEVSLKVTAINDDGETAITV